MATQQARRRLVGRRRAEQKWRNSADNSVYREEIRAIDAKIARAKQRHKISKHIGNAVQALIVAAGLYYLITHWPE